MRAILEEFGFDQNDIETIETRSDYETIQNELAGRDTDELLSLLEVRTLERNESLEERWNEVKKQLILIIEAQRTVSEDTTQSLERFRDRLEQEATERLEVAVRNRVGWIPLIGDTIATWIIEHIKRRDEDTSSASFGESLSRGLFHVALSFFWLRGLADQFKRERQEIQATQEPQAEDDQGGTDEPSESGENLQQTLLYEGVVTFLLYNTRHKNDNTRILLMHEQVKSSSYAEILGENFVASGASSTDIEVLQEMLRSYEYLFDGILARRNPDWKNLTLIEIFGEIAKYRDVFGGIQNLHLGDLFEGSFDLFSFTVTEEGLGGNLQVLLDEQRNNEDSLLAGVQRGLLIELIRDNSKKITDTDLELYLQNNSYNTETDRRFEEDFVAFGREFLEIIMRDYYLGDESHRARFEAYFREHSLSLKDTLEFYILTGGSRDSGSYTDMTRSLIYFKVWSILGRQGFGNRLRAETYNSFIRRVLLDGSKEAKESVPEIFWTLLGHAQEKAVDGAIELGKQTVSIVFEAFNSLSTEQKIVVGTLGAGTVILIIRGRIFLTMMRGMVIGLKVAGILAILATAAYAQEDFREKFPEIESESELYQAMLDELEGHGIDVSEVREQEFSAPSDRRREAQDAYLQEHGMIRALEREYTVGVVSIRERGDAYSNREFLFSVEGEPRSVYVNIWVGNGENIARNIMRNAFFTQDSEGQIYLAVPPARQGLHYEFISLSELNTRLREFPDNSEYILAERIWFGRNLLLAGAQ